MMEVTLNCCTYLLALCCIFAGKVRYFNQETAFLLARFDCLYFLDPLLNFFLQHHIHILLTHNIGSSTITASHIIAQAPLYYLNILLTIH